MSDYTSKYRPTKFEDVIGQDTIVESLKGYKDKNNGGDLPVCILLSGPSGCGKTTLARIAASYYGCDPSNILEIDAATKTGIDDIREVIDFIQYQPFTENKTRVVIIDEAHALSRQAITSLLKSTEEPPAGAHWILCTTDPTKIPTTLKTRCHRFELKSVESSKLLELLNKVVKEEQLSTDSKILKTIALRSEGSPRQALTFLSMVRNLPLDKAQDLIKTTGTADASPNVIDFCRILAKKGTFAEAVAVIKMIEEDPESVRIIVNNYISKCILGSKSEENTKYLLGILYAFKGPTFYSSDKIAPLLIASASVLLD